MLFSLNLAAQAQRYEMLQQIKRQEFKVYLSQGYFIQSLDGSVRQRYLETQLPVCFGYVYNEADVGWAPMVQANAIVEYMNQNKSLFGASQESKIVFSKKNDESCQLDQNINKNGGGFYGMTENLKAINIKYSPRYFVVMPDSDKVGALINLNIISKQYMTISLQSLQIKKILTEIAVPYTNEQAAIQKNIEEEKINFNQLALNDDKTHLVALGLKNPTLNYKHQQNGAVSVCTSKASNIPSYQLRGYMQSLKGMKMGEYLIAKPIHTEAYPSVDDFYSQLLDGINISPYNLSNVYCNLYIDYPKNVYLLQNAMLKALPKFNMPRWHIIADAELKTNAVAWQNDLNREEIERVAQAERDQKRKEAENAASLQRQQQRAANEERNRRESIALEASMRKSSLAQGFSYTAYLSCEVASARVNVVLKTCFTNLELTNGSFYHNYTFDLHTISNVNTYGTHVLPLRSSFEIYARAMRPMDNLRINIKIIDNKSGALVYQKSFVQSGEFFRINQMAIYAK
jgi:hypothetical protein